MQDGTEMVDFVIYALEPTGPSAGKEMPNSMVRLMRLPKEERLRLYDRFSGPWEDIRLGLNHTYRRIEVPGIHNPRATRKVLEPVNMDGGTPTSIDPASYPIKGKETHGTLTRRAGQSVPTFSKDNAEYLRKTCLHHFQHGTMSELGDESGDAVYIEELPKLLNLVGKKIYWEFRPYVMTAVGAAPGVDEYKLSLVAEDKNEIVGSEESS
jgi:hypothetical protein